MPGPRGRGRVAVGFAACFGAGGGRQANAPAGGRAPRPRYRHDRDAAALRHLPCGGLRDRCRCSTWLLDHRTVVVLPPCNPDGYYRVYHDGRSSWYKNANATYCPSNPLTRGADINRNYPWAWNTVGTGQDQCDASYPGPTALSEPESRGRAHSGRGGGVDLSLNLQAPGPGVLYPWGYTDELPPDADGLATLGRARQAERYSAWRSENPQRRPADQRHPRRHAMRHRRRARLRQHRL